MKMLLRDIGFVELSTILERNKKCSSAPHLIDPKARTRARKTAQKNGIWHTLSNDFDPTQEIPVVKRSVLRTYLRNGNRVPHEEVERARSRELENAALALWLDHPKADLDYLQDLLWAYCDDWTWVMPPHIYAKVDLGSAALAARFAEILYALEDRIEDEVKERVRNEIEKRVLRKVWDYDNTEFWHTARMNWNHVCNGSFIRAALLEIQDPRKLARAIHPAIQNMTYALDGFTDDGGCKEGPGYWGYGFGHFVQAAYALHCRTGGEINIMLDEKVERICRYPLASHIEGTFRTCFGDGGHGVVETFIALLINHFYNIPELYELCPRRKSGKPVGAGALQVNSMHSLGLYKNEKATGKADQRDYVLSDLGLVNMRGMPGKAQMTVAALTGNNGVPHNHNDIGSFIVYSKGRMFLTDPGGPLYNSQTFGEQRYEILWCRSRGHSVPIINGREQQVGKQYRGELSVEGLNESGLKKVAIDMSKAYPKGTVKKLIRTLVLNPELNELTIEDDYKFSSKPKSLEEAFVTFEKSIVTKDRSVRIGTKSDGLTLVADQEGTFNVETPIEKPEHTKPGIGPLNRIIFVPEILSRQIKLSFTLKQN